MEFSKETLSLLILLSIWVIPWKGMALWKAVKSNDKKWFIAILIINTLGILEIFYLFAIKPKVKIMAKKTRSKS